MIEKLLKLDKLIITTNPASVSGVIFLFLFLFGLWVMVSRFEYM